MRYIWRRDVFNISARVCAFIIEKVTALINFTNIKKKVEFLNIAKNKMLPYTRSI